MKHLTFGIVAAGSLLGALATHAGLSFTIENPGVQFTTVPGVTTEAFDARPLGAFSGAVAMGTLSGGGAIVAPDAFGGSSQTRYYAVGVQSGGTAATLTLTTPQNYVGLWWPAGDGQNRLEFYDGASLLGSYRVGDIIPSLSSAYFGNPNTALNPNEPYVYLNFTTTGSSSISSVRFLNDSTGSGFEIDSISVTPDRITPPGHSVPDAGPTAALLASAFAAVTALRRKVHAA